jgi:hypothetical protein
VSERSEERKAEVKRERQAMKSPKCR